MNTWTAWSTMNMVYLPCREIAIQSQCWHTPRCLQVMTNNKRECSKQTKTTLHAEANFAFSHINTLFNYNSHDTAGTEDFYCVHQGLKCTVICSTFSGLLGCILQESPHKLLCMNLYISGGRLWKWLAYEKGFVQHSNLTLVSWCTNCIHYPKFSYSPILLLP